MKLSPVRAGGYLLLAFGGWSAGRWVWPALPDSLRTPAVTGVFDNWKNKAAAGEALGKSLARSMLSD